MPSASVLVPHIPGFRDKMAQTDTTPVSFPGGGARRVEGAGDIAPRIIRAAGSAGEAKHVG